MIFSAYVKIPTCTSLLQKDIVSVCPFLLRDNIHLQKGPRRSRLFTISGTAAVLLLFQLHGVQSPPPVDFPPLLA